MPASSGDHSALRPDDVMFGKLLVRLGHATDEQVRESIEEQARTTGSTTRLGDIMVRKGYISVEAIEQVLEARRTMTTLVCPVCQAKYPVLKFDPKRAYKCKAPCGAPLKAPDAEPTQGQSTPKISFTFKQVPEVVKKAATNPKKIFGKYVLIRKLGAGGMGEVWCAWDTALNRYMAIKFLLGEGQTETEIQRFLREAQTSASLSHPNIIGTLDVGQIDGRYYIAMQYVEGYSLNGKRQSVRRAMEIIRQVALAVEHAHANNIIHRDLKPHNIMLDKSGHPFVMDFGLARSIKGDSKLTQSGIIMGTPSYMAPEQAEGDPERMGKRTDVYSLGATLYELLTGRPPFTGKNPLEVLMKLTRSDPKPLRLVDPKLPAEVEIIVAKAMEKEPRNRYPTAKAFADDVGRFLHGDAIVAQAPTMMTKMRKRVRKNRALLLPAIAAAGVIVIGVSAWMVLASQKLAEVRTLVTKADKAYKDEKWKEALDLYTQADAKKTGDAHVRARKKECQAKLDEARRKSDEETMRADQDRLEAERREQEAAAAQKRRVEALADAQSKFDAGMSKLESARQDYFRAGASITGARKKANEAIESFDEAIRIYPEHHDAFLQRGRAQVLAQDYDAAVESFSRAIELQPTSVLPLVERGLMHLNRYVLGKIDYQTEPPPDSKIHEWGRLALADLEAAEAAGIGERADYVKAMILLAKNEHLAAIPVCQRAIEADPNDEMAYKLMGDIYHLGTNVDLMQAGDATHRKFIDTSIEYYTKAIQLRVNYAEALAMRGLAHEKTGNAQAQRDDLTAAAAIDDRNFLGLYGQGQLRSQDGDLDGAIESFDKALAIFPDSYLVSVCRAAVYGNRGAKMKRESDFNAAVADCVRATKIHPGHYHAWQLLGAIYSRMGRYGEAIEALEKSLTINGRFAATWYNLGATKQNNGDLAGARAAYLKAIELDHPSSEALREMIKKIDETLGNM